MIDAILLLLAVIPAAIVLTWPELIVRLEAPEAAGGVMLLLLFISWLSRWAERGDGRRRSAVELTLLLTTTCAVYQIFKLIADSFSLMSRGDPPASVAATQYLIGAIAFGSALLFVLATRLRNAPPLLARSAAMTAIVLTPLLMMVSIFYIVLPVDAPFYSDIESGYVRVPADGPCAGEELYVKPGYAYHLGTVEGVWSRYIDDEGRRITAIKVIGDWHEGSAIWLTPDELSRFFIHRDDPAVRHCHPAAVDGDVRPIGKEIHAGSGWTDERERDRRK
jgi:hypothetical protein